MAFSCSNSPKQKKDIVSADLNNSLKQDSSKPINQIDEILKSIPKNIKPLFGYRFVISGDFDGDGKKEKLIEHFFSAIDNQETNKYYNGLNDFAQEVALTVKKEPYSFVSSDNKRIDTLPISSGGQLLGLSYLKNEGDLTGDGSDEISYVVNWADWSSTNTWHLMTYKNKRWIELYSFPIWDWQIPDLPETFEQHELFGIEQRIMKSENDSINKNLEKELKTFKGLVRKIRTNKIQVIFRNNEAEEDTMIVDLK